MICMDRTIPIVEEETTIVIALLSSMPMTWMYLVPLVFHVLEFPVGIRFILVQSKLTTYDLGMLNNLIK